MYIKSLIYLLQCVIVQALLLMPYEGKIAKTEKQERQLQTQTLASACYCTYQLTGRLARQLQPFLIIRALSVNSSRWLVNSLVLWQKDSGG